MNTEIQNRLQKVVAQYIPAEANDVAITDSTNFLTDLKINSANLVDIMLDVEDEFDITINNEEMDKMTTVGNAMKIINAKL